MSADSSEALERGCVARELNRGLPRRGRGSSLVFLILWLLLTPGCATEHDADTVDAVVMNQAETLVVSGADGVTPEVVNVDVANADASHLSSAAADGADVDALDGSEAMDVGVANVADGLGSDTLEDGSIATAQDAASDDVGDTQPSQADAPSAVDVASASTPTDPPASGGKLKVVLGGASADATAWLDWSSILPVVTAIFGKQGSHHFWVSFCVPDTFGTAAKVRLSLFLQGTKVKIFPGETNVTTQLKTLANHPGQRCRLALPGFVICACTLHARVLRLRLEVMKDKVVQGWAERSVQLVVPANSPCPMQGKMPCAAQLPSP